MIRKLPAVEQRVETGPVQFGEDWPGVFIRGDHAFWLCNCLDALLVALREQKHDDSLMSAIAVVGLEGLRRTLSESDLTGLSKPPEGATVDPDWKSLALRYEAALRHLAETAFASKDWKYARAALQALPAPQEPSRNRRV